MVAPRRIQEIPDLGSVQVETGAVFYRCKTCDFNTENPEAARAHVLENNRGRRRDSWWRHEIETLSARDCSP